MPALHHPCVTGARLGNRTNFRCIEGMLSTSDPVNNYVAFLRLIDLTDLRSVLMANGCLGATLAVSTLPN